MEKAGEMILGAVYNPNLNESHLAEKGQGATLNNKLIRVSEETEVSKACLVTGFPIPILIWPTGRWKMFYFIRKGNSSAAWDLRHGPLLGGRRSFRRIL